MLDSWFQLQETDYFSANYPPDSHKIKNFSCIRFKFRMMEYDLLLFIAGNGSDKVVNKL